MREIKIPIERIKKWIEKPEGIALVIPVIVNWQELKLTEDQQIANCIAEVNGKRKPYEDNSIFDVVITYSGKS